MIKYRYALDSKDNLVDVNDLERHSISKVDKYFTVDFKQELIPRLGKIKIKHFALKPHSEILGSNETYLHALGKKVFKDEYNNSLLTGIPFYIAYKLKQTCTRLKPRFNITCELADKELLFDLASYYTQIKEETRDGNLIPDIMISNHETQEKIYIEIAVTHFSSDRKLDSGTRIIEIVLNSEDDISSIKELRMGNSSSNINLYNFKKRHERGIFCKKGSCNHNFDIFLVSKNGRSRLEANIDELELETIVEHADRSDIWYKIYPIEKNPCYEYREFTKFKEYVVNAHQVMGKVKNCYICRYHAENRSIFPSGSIFCKFLKVGCQSNNAADCQYYRVDNTYLR